MTTGQNYDVLNLKIARAQTNLRVKQTQYKERCVEMEQEKERMVQEQKDEGEESEYFHNSEKITHIGLEHWLLYDL